MGVGQQTLKARTAGEPSCAEQKTAKQQAVVSAEQCRTTKATTIKLVKTTTTKQAASCQLVFQ